MSNLDNIKPPVIKKEDGSLHPVSQVIDYLLNVLTKLGFQEVDGPEIESEEFNFDMLNIKKTHPARQMHDTFYLENKSNVLRTHTSPVQIRSMLDSGAPLAIVSSGKVYRKDDDATHLPMFHQVEGIYVDENISFANLKNMIYKIIEFLFEGIYVDKEVNFAQLKDLIHNIIYAIFGKEVQIRFRPSYFPFTEPSAEVDILSKNGKWLEILGCGIVNPVVLENCKIDSNIYSGLAFGLGVERIAMLKYQVNDIREFYKSNMDFLNQFK